MSAGTATSAISTSGWPKLTATLRGRPRTAAASHRTSRARRAARRAPERTRATPLRSSAAAVREALAKRSAARVDSHLASGLRVDEPQVADVRQLLLARVADLDGEDVVAAHQLQQRLPPVERPAEVGDDHDDTALPRDRCGTRDRLPERRRPDLRLLRLALQRLEQAEQSGAALVRRQRRRASSRRT